MATLYQFLEGWQGYGTLSSANGFWAGTSLNESNNRLTDGPREGSTASGSSGRSLETRWRRVMPTSGSWVKVGAHVRVDTLSQVAAPIALLEGTTTHLSIVINTSGAVELRRGGETGALLGTSATGLVAANSWVWIEARIRIADSTADGDCVLAVNGVTQITLGAGVDTREGGSGVVDTLQLWGHNSAFWCDRADVYFEVVEGQSDALYGPCRIDTVYPTSDGHHQDGTPSTGADRWATVDETSVSASDYNDLADVGDRDSFGVGTLPALTDPAVYGVQVHVSALASDAGARSMAPMLRVGSTDYDGAAAALSPSLLGYTAAWPTNPAGGAWTQSAAQAAQPGAVVTA